MHCVITLYILGEVHDFLLSALSFKVLLGYVLMQGSCCLFVFVLACVRSDRWEDLFVPSRKQGEHWFYIVSKQ